MDISSFLGDNVPSDRDMYYNANFHDSLLACRACPIREEAARVIPGVGPADAKVIFAGRNPGIKEDDQGQPFVGPGGRELNKMLVALNLDRQDVGIINVVKCHTTDDRAPKDFEAEICTSNWLRKELAFFSQAILLFPLGHLAIKVFLGPTATSPAKHEGYLVNVALPNEDPKDTRPARLLSIIPLNHPGYLLRQRGKGMEMYNNTLPRVKKIIMQNESLRKSIYGKRK